MAHFSKGKTNDITSENKLPAETSGASDTQQAGSETLPSDGTDEAGVTDAEGPETGVSDGDVTDVSETEAAAEPMPDPADADNVWAMFLVNGKTPFLPNTATASRLLRSMRAGENITWTQECPNI